MTDLTPRSKPAGTSPETYPETATSGPAESPAGAGTGATAGTSAGTPGGTEPGTAPDTARGTRARPLSDKAAGGGPDQDRYPASGTPAPTTGEGRPATARRHDTDSAEDRRDDRRDDRRHDHHDDRQGTDRDTTDWLLPRDECDRLAGQMRHAVSGFVDGPGAAVEEADRVLEEAAARFTDAVARRRRSLRRAWQPIGAGDGDGRNGGSGTPNADTEVLRLALRDYRELTDRLLSR